MDWIEKQAVYYRNLARASRVKAVVHLEDKEDETFWNAQLQNASQGQYLFIYHSKSNTGTDTRGCEQCLKFLPYLNRHFFICIDSDLRLLRADARMQASRYVGQTYAYSWENHLCEALHLVDRIKAMNVEAEFDFCAFLSAFSRIVYRPLLYLVAYGADSTTNSQWNVSKMNACIPLQPSRVDLANNGEAYLRKVQALFDTALAQLALPQPADVAGLTPPNAYLHMQGHRLYDLIQHIGSLLCRATGVAFTTQILNTGLHTSGYYEIDALQHDLSAILNNRN